MDDGSTLRWSMTDFMAREGAGSPPVALPDHARQRTAPGEWVRLLGSGPIRVLLVPCAFLVFEAAVVAGYYEYFVRRSEVVTPVEYGTLGVLFFGMVASFLVMVWALTSSVVIVSNRRVIVARRWSRRIEAEIAHEAIESIEQRVVHVAGLTTHRYELRLRTGESRSLGAIDFVRVGA